MKLKSTLIIAEAGVNHNGSMELAYKLIDAAADAGADLVKFQTFNARKLVTESADKANYQKQATDADESQYEMLANLELTNLKNKNRIQKSFVRNTDYNVANIHSDTINNENNATKNITQQLSDDITNYIILTMRNR